MRSASRTIAVALHDIEPATFERCALIRDWLDDHGVGRVTLLVIPARDLHPLAERSPEMVSWLIERERGGDAIAQHGFQHFRSQRARGHYHGLRGYDEEPEFLGLDAHETRRAVNAGRRVLKLAGIEPRGFVAPAYAYTPALRSILEEHFHWWAALLRLHRSDPLTRRNTQNQVLSAQSNRPVAQSNELSAQSNRLSAYEQTDQRSHHKPLGPPLAFMNSGRLRSALSPSLLRLGALMSRTTLRLDLHPSDLEDPSRMLALEWVLKHAAPSRKAVTYDELAFPTAAALQHSAHPQHSAHIVRIGGTVPRVVKR